MLHNAFCCGFGLSLRLPAYSPLKGNGFCWLLSFRIVVPELSLGLADLFSIIACLQAGNHIKLESVSIINFITYYTGLGDY